MLREGLIEQDAFEGRFAVVESDDGVTAHEDRSDSRDVYVPAG